MIKLILNQFGSNIFLKISTSRFDEFGFRVENISDLSRDCILTDDVFEDPQHRYFITKYLK